MCAVRGNCTRCTVEQHWEEEVHGKEAYEKGELQQRAGAHKGGRATYCDSQSGIKECDISQEKEGKWKIEA